MGAQQHWNGKIYIIHTSRPTKRYHNHSESHLKNNGSTLNKFFSRFSFFFIRLIYVFVWIKEYWNERWFYFLLCNINSIYMNRHTIFVFNFSPHTFASSLVRWALLRFRTLFLVYLDFLYVKFNLFRNHCTNEPKKRDSEKSCDEKK